MSSHSRTRRPLAAGLALGLLTLAAPGWAAAFDILVERLSGDTAPLVEALRRAAGPGRAAGLHEVLPETGMDPILKGRLLARLLRAELLVPVGDAATRFVSQELAESPAFFVGASVVDGAYLSSPQVGGILALDPQRVLTAASALGLRRIALVYTPGYAPVAARLAALAATAGLSLTEARVASSRQLAPALRGLFGKVQAVWVLGDPLLVRGAGFEFLVEQSLANKVPLIAASPWEVERGALFCPKLEPRDMAAPASAALKRLLEPGAKSPRPGLTTAQGGSLVYHGGLMTRLGLKPPEEGAWRPIQ